ncbi:MAG: flagellar hook-length control protein FliK [Phycisphaerales bacterium]|nr:flagellar hook-length control protein FliK [Phycisphaerales bacterium]
MTITPIETTHSNQPSLRGDAGFLRTSSAHDAQAFAQVLQGFESESESIVVDSLQNNSGNELGEESDTDDANQVDEPIADGDEANTDDDSVQDEQVSSSDQSSQSVDSDQSSNSEDADKDQVSKQSTDSHEQSIDTQVVSNTSNIENTQSTPSTAAPVQEPTLANDSTLRLLENQSDQAKLSIKGLVKSKIQSSSADLTSIAIETKLGKQSNVGNPTPIDPTGTSGPKSIDKHSDLPPTNEALSSSPPQSERQIEVNQLNHVIGNDSKSTQVPSANQSARPTNTQATSESTNIRADQVGVEVNSIKTLRVDAGAVASAGVARVNVHDRGVAHASSAQLVDGNRAQALTSRAVTGVEASDLGQLRGDSHSESSVKNIRQAEMRGEPNRAGVLAQVQRGLASLLRSGKNEMTLKLTPEHLGEIRIRVQTEGLELAVRFETSNDEATELLQGQLKDLGNQLRSKGFNIDRISLGDDSTQGSDSSSTSNENNSDNSESESGHHHNSQDSSNPERNENQTIGFDEPDSELDVDSIWTDIGLDAIA